MNLFTVKYTRKGKEVVQKYQLGRVLWCRLNYLCRLYKESLVYGDSIVTITKLLHRLNRLQNKQ